MRLFTRGFLAPLFCALIVAGCATPPDCNQRYARSPQAVPGECKFQNLPNPQAKAQRDTWDIWMHSIVDAKHGTVPIDPLPVRKLDRAALDALDNGANHIIRLGHSAHLLKLRGKWWLIDPMLSPHASPVSWIGPKRFTDSPVSLADMPAIEGVVISHDHYDHLDAPSIAALKDKVQRFFVPLGVGERLKGFGVAADRIEELDWWEERKWGEVTVTATPAQHFSGRTPFDRSRTLWAGWSLRSGGEHIYYSGDSGYFPGFKEIAKRLGAIDIALIENGAYDSYWSFVHMTPQETVQAFQDLGARTLMPVHNCGFDLAFHGWSEPLERVAAIAREKGLALATPELGEALTLGRQRENRTWWAGLR